MPGKILKAAVIGCGRIGAEFDTDPKRKYVATHVGAYASLKNIKLVGVVDPDPRKLAFVKKRWPKTPGFYQSIDELFRKEPHIDLISVCTPPETHLQVIREILKYPVKGIFCEKPIANLLSEGQSIIRLCKKNNVRLQIGHQRRFDALHQRLRRIIHAGKLGQLQQANFYYTAGIWNTGTHMFDLLSFLFGPFEWIQAHASHISSPRPKDINLDGLLKTKKGACITFQACDVKKYLLFELNAYFEKAQIKLTHSGFKITIFEPVDSRLFSGYKELQPAKVPFDTSYKRNFMVEGVQELTRAVIKKKNSISSGEDGLYALKLIHRALRSSDRQGSRIFI